MADRKISDLTALTTPASGDYLPIVDISEAAAASKNKRITIEELMRGVPDGTAAAPGIAFETDPNTGIYRPGADQLAVATNGVERVKFGGAVIFNDGSTDTDFRIEGVTDANLFFVDASTNRVGVGTSSPAQLLDVRGDAQIGQTGQNSLNIRSSAGSGQFIYFTEHAIADRWLLGSSAGSGDLVARSGAYNFSTGSERLRITAAGLVGVGTSSPVTTLTVKGPTNGNVVTLFGSSGDSARKLVISNSDNDNDWDIDANRGTYGALSLSTGGTKRLQIDASGNVGIGTTSPAMPLSVKADLSRNAIQIINGGSGTEEGRLYWYASNASTIRAGISGQENGLVFFHGAGVTERARIDSSGRLLVGTGSDSGGALFQVNGDRIRVGTAKTPATSGATGTTGEIAWDADYIYVCTATNTWKRSAIATW